ncbi:MAG: hypothetical protein KAS39_02020, partial [Actinomycetia bacterium]|nr:hypothetical protein [Actinomycetes bacterium]
MIKRLRLNLLFLIFIFLLLPQPVLGESPKKAILIVVDRVTYNELFSSGKITQLAKNSSTGLLNVKSGYSYNPASSYLTIGTGARVKARTFLGLALNTEEYFQEEKISAAQEYFQKTHLNAPVNGIVNLKIASIFRENLKGQSETSLGVLGDILKENGMKIAVLGNADSLSIPNKISYHREAALIGMDHTGRIFQGDVGKSFWLEDMAFPGNLRTDFGNLLKKSRQMLKETDLLIIETGDVTRIENLYSTLWEQVIREEKTEAISRIGKFIDELLYGLDPQNTLAIILSPSPSTEAIKEKNTLTPIVIWGSSFSNSLLFSKSTKRPGVISSIDIAPTILSFLGLETEDFLIGYPIEPREKKDFFEYSSTLYEQISFIEKLRTPFLKGYITLVVIVLILSTILLLFPSPYIPTQIVQFFIIWVLSFPFALLLISLFLPFSNVLFIFYILIITFSVSMFAFSLKKNVIGPVISISVLTSLALVLDIIVGSPLMQKSILGYSPVIGARYYGLGNEYMGVLIGSSIIGIFGVFQWRNTKNLLTKRMSVLLFALLIVVIGYPAFGANIGGAITAIVSCFLAYLFLTETRIKPRHLFYIFFSVLGAVVLIAVISVFFVSSHAGITALLVRQSGVQALFDVVSRKLSMNLRL